MGVFPVSNALGHWIYDVYVKFLQLWGCSWADTSSSCAWFSWSLVVFPLCDPWLPHGQWGTSCSLEWGSFVILVQLEEEQPFPGKVEGWGWEEEEGTTGMLIKWDHQTLDWIKQRSSWEFPLGAPRLCCSFAWSGSSGACERLVLWWQGGQEGFFSPFSAGSARNPSLMPIGSYSNLFSPRVQRGKEMDSTKYHSKEGPSVIVTVHNLSLPLHWITVNPALLLVTAMGTHFSGTSTVPQLWCFRQPVVLCVCVWDCKFRLNPLKICSSWTERLQTPVLVKFLMIMSFTPGCPRIIPEESL